MSPLILTTDDSLPPDVLERVIEACERFEAAWNAGRPLRIEDELAAAKEAITTRLFRELLALECELTRRDGHAARPEHLPRPFSRSAQHRPRGVQSSPLYRHLTPRRPAL